MRSSLVMYGLTVTLAYSSLAVRANENEKERKQSAGGKPPAGAPVAPTKPGTGQAPLLNQKPAGTPKLPMPNSGQGGAIPGKSTGPLGGTPAGTAIPTTGIPVGTKMQIFDRWGNLIVSAKSPTIRIEPRSLPGNFGLEPRGNPTLRQINGGVELYSDFTWSDSRVNPESGQPAIKPKLTPLAVSKLGYLGSWSNTSRNSDVTPGTDKQTGIQDHELNSLLMAKNRDDMIQRLHAFKIAENESPIPRDRFNLDRLNLNKISGVHQERLANLDNLPGWKETNVTHKLDLKRQFEFQRQGDLTRRMNLHANLMSAGGWAKHRQYGIVSPGFTSTAFSVWYAGGGSFPAHAWCPAWSQWVDWSFWGTCPAFYDPRPTFCLPFVYGPCLPWVYYAYPVWLPLPMIPCGTWIDEFPVVATAGVDLQLLAVRFVDNGHPTQNVGPRYRVWVKNNSPVQIMTPFSVLLMASNEQIPTIDLPQAGAVVPSMESGEIQAIDIRLPLAANRLRVTQEGDRVPFAYLHVLVDSFQQIMETYENNNGAVLARMDILPVDPAAFSTDLTASAPESLLTIAGEGFGPEPGQVIVSIHGQQVQAEIHGWYDLGVQFAVPNFDLTQPVGAEVIVVRGDKAASNPLSVRFAPREMLEEPPMIPESPTPNKSQ